MAELEIRPVTTVLLAEASKFVKEMMLDRMKSSVGFLPSVPNFGQSLFRWSVLPH